MKKKLKELKEAPKVKIPTHSLRTTLKKYQMGNRQAMMTYIDYD